jgi:hypothetical protein
MEQDGARIHAMKMGYGGVGRAAGRESDAMIMAWTATAAPTMVRPLTRAAQIHRQRLPMKNSTQNSMQRSIYLALVLAVAGISHAGAQSGPSPQEQMACRSDAGKFCAEHVGKPPQMNACLRENKAKLSEPCRKVVESHGG